MSSCDFKEEQEVKCPVVDDCLDKLNELQDHIQDLEMDLELYDTDLAVATI